MLDCVYCMGRDLVIYEDMPNTWQDLQNSVANLLEMAGYRTEVEVDVETVRGITNVDVFAINNTSEPNNKILCECKYWNKAVPKTVVHAFRTIVSDFGANYGFIISRRGFQKGAFDAVKNTNVILLTCEQFQCYFRNSWITHRQLEVSRETKPLFDFVSAGALVFFKKEIEALNNDERMIFDNLCMQHFNVAFYAMNQDYKSDVSNSFDFDRFLRLFNAAQKDFKAEFPSIQRYFLFLLARANEGLAEFDLLFRKKLRRDS